MIKLWNDILNNPVIKNAVMLVTNIGKINSKLFNISNTIIRDEKVLVMEEMRAAVPQMAKYLGGTLTLNSL